MSNAGESGDLYLLERMRAAAVAAIQPSRGQVSSVRKALSPRLNMILTLTRLAFVTTATRQVLVMLVALP